MLGFPSQKLSRTKLQLSISSLLLKEVYENPLRSSPNSYLMPIHKQFIYIYIHKNIFEYYDHNLFEAIAKRCLETWGSSLGMQVLQITSGTN